MIHLTQHRRHRGVSSSAPSTSLYVGTAELPRVFLTTTVASTPSTGRTITVSDGNYATLQAAFNNAIPGDTIILANGTAYTANGFTLTGARSGGVAGDWITIKSATLPCAEGTRVTPTSAAAANIAKMVTPNVSPLLNIQHGMNKVRFIGIEFTATPQGGGVDYNYGLVSVGAVDGSPELSIEDMPTDIIFDRCYAHGDPVRCQRAFGFNGVRNSLIDSWVERIYQQGTDSQAVFGYAGPGPFKIVNNYLESEGENILFGGADPPVYGVSPSDIEIRYNHIPKTDFIRTLVGGTAKNLVEIKHARRFLLEGNYIEHSWPAGQDGYGLIFQSLTDHPENAPWTESSDIVVRNNIIDDTQVALSMSAHGWNASGVAMHDIAIVNNLWTNVGDPAYYFARISSLGGELADVLYEHNTAIKTDIYNGQPVLVNYGSFGKGSNLNINNNAFGNCVPYGAVFGEGGYLGPVALDRGFSSWLFEGNLMWQFASGTWPLTYSATNRAALTEAAVDFASDWSLAATSPYKGMATDGTDPGVDRAALDAALVGVVVDR